MINNKILMMKIEWQINILYKYKVKYNKVMNKIILKKYIRKY
jgi:hypothetical protein